MTPSERRRLMKEQLNDRLQESYNNKDDSGKYKSVIIKSALGKVGMWKCGEGEHFINIIPYIVGDKHPSLKAGSMAYSLDYFEHRKVGVNEDNYVCLSRTFNQKCPICEEQANLRKQEDYDEKYVKSLNPTRRVLYNIECLDSDKEANLGIQLFEVSHYLFEKELAEIAKKPRGGGFELFSDPDDGKIVFFRRSGSGATNTEYKAFKFEDRSEQISDELLDAALCLDSLIYVPAYEEVYAAFHGHPVEDDEVPTHVREERKSEADPAGSGARAARRPASRQPAPEPEPEMIVEEEPEFVHPCESAKEYGTHDLCDSCPDAETCEGEYNAILEEEAAAEAKRLEEEEAKKAKAAEAAPASRRVARGAAPAAEPAAEPAAPAAEGERRVRRRPGA